MHTGAHRVPRNNFLSFSGLFKTCEHFSASAYSASRWTLILSISGSEMGRATRAGLPGGGSVWTASKASWELLLKRDLLVCVREKAKLVALFLLVQVATCAYVAEGCAGIFAVLEFWVCFYEHAAVPDLSMSFPAPEKVLVTFLR